MIELEELANQVLHNCYISDSRFAGNYSICGLAMRLRDLYKWENGLEPWIEKDFPGILDWIGEREENWNTLEGQDFKDIVIHGRKYNPFDLEGINAQLGPLDLFYGGGYGLSLKPTFVLARLEEKKEIYGFPVYILGRELARDLFTVPALSQEDSIIVRREAAKLYIWDQIFYIKESCRPALNFALEQYGIEPGNQKEVQRAMPLIAAAETEVYMYHESGELLETGFDRDVWREVIAAFPHSPLELLVRSIKDLLADTNEFGRLAFIIRGRKAASLGFFTAFLEGLARELFPEIQEAFSEFKECGDWGLIEAAKATGYKRVSEYAGRITHIHLEAKRTKDESWAKKELTEKFLKPLNLDTATLK